MRTKNKISIKHVVGDIRKVIKEHKITDRAPIMRIIGVAQSFVEGSSDYGDWVALTGQFKATNLLTDEDYVAGKCFVPDSVTDLVLGYLKDGGASVEMAFDIHLIIDDSSSVGYTYEAETLMEISEDSAIARLESQLSGNKKLAAPGGKKKAA